LRPTDPEFERFLEVAYLNAEPAKRELGTLARALGMTAPALERLLLAWEERGWLTFRGERRDAVVERVPPPSDTADAINRILEQKDAAHQRQVDLLLAYASRDECRHKMLAAHLGEVIEECETSCDYCAPPADRPSQAEEVLADLPDNPGRVIVECLSSFPFTPGKPSLVKALQGSAASNVNATRVRHFGALASASPSAIGRAIDELVEGGYLTYFEEQGFRLLRVTHDGLDGVPLGAVSLKPKRRRRPKEERAATQRQRRAESSPYPVAKRADDDREPTPEEVDIFERLRAWRRVVANRQGIPPYMVFHDRTLWAIAKAHPRSEGDLSLIKGIGQSGLDKYGSDLLNLLSESE
jgi:ATP-dependent DNA helicase RecQ